MTERRDLVESAPVWVKNDSDDPVNVRVVEGSLELSGSVQSELGTDEVAALQTTATKTTESAASLAALSALISGGLFAVGGSVLTAIKTAVEALAAIISGGRLLVTANATLQAGSASIGSVDVNLGSSSTAFDDAVATLAGATATTLASHAGLKVGFYITNTHASHILFVGTSSVNGQAGTERFLHKIPPGQQSPLIACSNPNAFSVRGTSAGSHASGCTYVLAGY